MFSFKTISSRENDRFKHLKRLRDSRKAHQAGVILLEGFRQVEDALLSGIEPTAILVRKDTFKHDRWLKLLPLLESLRNQSADSQDSIEWLLLDDRLFADLADTKSPQGIMMLAHSPVYQPENQSADPKGLYLVLESIQDPGNLGTMLRTADAFAFAGVILSGASADPYSDKALRSAMGSAFHVPVLRFETVRQAVDWLKSAKLPILAAALTGQPLAGQNLSAQGAALLIGNEGSGLSAEALALADQTFKIEMPGRAESLNASAAAAILCHWLSMRLN